MKFDPSRIILGCANLGGLFLDGVKPDFSRAVAIVGQARALGISKFDTAPLYGWGASEYFLGRALEHLQVPRKDFQILSKSLRSLYPCVEARDTSQPDFWTLGEPNSRLTHRWRLDYDSVMMTTCRSLETLRTSYVDGLSFHDIGDAFAEDPTVTWEKLDEAIRAVKELKKAGFVKQIGFGGKESKTLKQLIIRHFELLDYAATTTYTILDQEFLSEGMFQFCADHGVEYRMAGPFGSRILAEDPRQAVRRKGKDGIERWYYHNNVDQPVTFNYHYITEGHFERACRLWSTVEEFGLKTPRAPAIQFVLAHPLVAAVIVGASKPEHLQDIKNDIEQQIDPRLWDALRRERVIREDAPVPA